MSVDDIINMSEQNINIRFVKAVQKHPSLYNFELPSYTRKDISDAAWEDVGRTMNMAPSACRERWRNLRAVFMRTIRAPPRGSTGKKKPYYLSEAMQFLLPFMRVQQKAEAAKEKQNQQEKEETTNPVHVIEDIKEEVQDNESDESSRLSAEEEKEIICTRKRPVQEEDPQPRVKVAKLVQPSLSASMILESDHVISFLNSLLPELHEMNFAQFKNFKRRVLQLIDTIVAEIPAHPRRFTDNDYIAYASNEDQPSYSANSMSP